MLTDTLSIMCSVFSGVPQVNLNFDPPETGPSVRSGLNHHASKFLELDLAAAQRVEVLPGRPGPNGAPQGKASDFGHVRFVVRRRFSVTLLSAVMSAPSRPRLEEQLRRQTETFLQQVTGTQTQIKIINF